MMTYLTHIDYHWNFIIISQIDNRITYNKAIDLDTQEKLIKQGLSILLIQVKENEHESIKDKITTIAALNKQTIR
jgi:hypothetical protein